MGKAGKVRSRGKRANPIARKGDKPADLSIDLNQLTDARKGEIIATVAKLKAADPAARLGAIREISDLIDDDVQRVLLLKEKLIQTILTSLITDSEVSVAAQAYGLLRELIENHGSELGVFMFRQDVITAAKLFLDKLRSEITEENVSNPQLTETLEKVIRFITTLANVSEAIFDAVDKKMDLAGDLAELALLFQNVDGTDDLFIAITECLYTLSQDNPDFIQKIEALPVDEILQSSKPALSHAYLIGLKFNAVELMSVSDDDNIHHILKGLANLGQNGITSTLHAELAEVEAGKRKKLSYEAQKELDCANVVLELTAAVAELLGGQSAGTQDPEEMEEDEEGDEGDLEFEKDISFDRPYDEEDESPSIHVLHSDVLPIVEESIKDTIFRQRALLALNNICWTVQAHIPAESPKWSKKASYLWDSLLEGINPSLEISLLSSMVGSLWAVKKSLGKQVQLSNAQTRSLIQITQGMDSSDEDVNELQVRIVGLLGLVGATSDDIEVTKTVSGFLVGIITSPLAVHGSVLIEALNAFFDLFADRSYRYDEPVFVKGGLLNVLQQSSPKVRSAIKKIDRTKYPVFREEGDEAALNLTRFIDYKKKERSS